MKIFSSVFVLVAAMISVSAFAANRKPAAKLACGSEPFAKHAAEVQAADDTGGTCTAGAVAKEGPVGGFFTTYHVSLTCGDSGAKNYDVESHMVGLPEHFTCTTSIHPAGQFEAN